MSKGHTTHGLGKPPLYSHWVNMKTRCLNKNNAKYKIYGGRGITICEEWLDFKNFHDWAMSNGFIDGLTLERIDVNGNYCPENCTWIPMVEQAKNKRTCTYLIHNGMRDTVAGWTKRMGYGRETIRERLKRGWSVKRAIETEPNRKVVISE